MAGEGTSESRYLFEFDGVTSLQATEVTGLAKDHTPFELYTSNRPNPRLGRGNYKIGDLTVKHASALNASGDEIFKWIEDFVNGFDVSKRSGRLIILDEDGQTPIDVWELQECIPKKFEIDSHTAGGNNPSFFRFVIQPTNFTKG